MLLCHYEGTKLILLDYMGDRVVGRLDWKAGARPSQPRTLKGPRALLTALVADWLPASIGAGSITSDDEQRGASE